MVVLPWRMKASSVNSLQYSVLTLKATVASLVITKKRPSGIKDPADRKRLTGALRKAGLNLFENILTTFVLWAIFYDDGDMVSMHTHRRGTKNHNLGE